MHSHVTTCLNFDTTVYAAVEAVLGEWTSEENLQCPQLVQTVVMRLGIEPTELKQIDSIVRRYVRSHPDWRVAKGVKGGIQRRADYNNRQAAKAALEAAKRSVKLRINAKLKAETPVVEAEPVETVSDQVDSEDEELLS